MSLVITGAGVNHGSLTAIDGATSLTFCIWVYPTQLTAATTYVLFFKQTGGAVGKSFGFSGPAIYAYVSRLGGGGYDERVSNDIVVLNTWNFIAITYDTTNKAKIYHGLVNKPATEVSYAVIDDVGSGGVGDDSAENLYIGSNSGAAAPMIGSIYGASYFKNLILSLPRIRQQQEEFRRVPGTSMVAIYGDRQPTHHFDLSGLSNHGTITGAAVSTDTPLKPRYRRRPAIGPLSGGGISIPVFVHHFKQQGIM